MQTRKVLIINTDDTVTQKNRYSILSEINKSLGFHPPVFSNDKYPVSSDSEHSSSVHTDKSPEDGASRSSIQTINLNNLAHYLGCTRDSAVLVQNLFNVDQIYSLFGSLSTSGLLIIITSLPRCFNDFFNSCTQKNIFEIFTAKEVLTHPQYISDFITSVDAGNYCLNFHNSAIPDILDTQQSSYIDIVTKYLHEKKNFVVHLDGSRGTGKTTATVKLVDTLVHSMFKCGVLNAGAKDIIPRYTAISDISLITTENMCEYVDKIDLLIIEEAAALPISHLFEILKMFPRTVLVTTLSGYEGSAMGLRHQLYQSFSITRIALHNHYRNNYDHAAKCLDTLFFNSPVNDIVINRFNHNRLSENPSEKSKCIYISTRNNSDSISVCTTGIELMKNNTGKFVLYLINSLLKSNHYEQTPQDLIRWITQEYTCLTFILVKAASMDSRILKSLHPFYINSRDLQMMTADHSVNAFFSSPVQSSENINTVSNLQNSSEDYVMSGVTISTCEGMIEPELAKAIMNGTRQPKNNLCPQTLITQAGFAEAGNYRYLRIERIAVLPELRRTSLATSMIKAVEGMAAMYQFNFLGVSFALSLGTARFWLSNDFKPVNISFTPDNASGKRSLLMMKDITANSECKQHNSKTLVVNRTSDTFNTENAFRLFKLKLPHLIIPFSLDKESEILSQLNISGISELFHKKENLNNIDEKLYKIESETLYDKISDSTVTDDQMYLLNDFFNTHFKNTIDSIVNGHHSLIHSIYEIKILFDKQYCSDRLSSDEKKALILFLNKGLIPKNELQSLLKTDGVKQILRQLRNIISKIQG